MNLRKFRLKAVVAIFSVLSILMSMGITQDTQAATAYLPVVTPSIDYGYIFIGDSRFVGMNDICKMSSIYDEYVIAQNGMGYDWLVNTAMPQADAIIATNPYKRWVLIMGLGVNDLSNINSYLLKYKELSAKYNIVLTSINPVENHEFISNSTIASFNSSLRTLGLPFIDTNSVLMAEGFSTIDGLHYTAATYIRINEIYQSLIQDNELNHTI